MVKPDRPLRDLLKGVFRNTPRQCLRLTLKRFHIHGDDALPSRNEPRGDLVRYGIEPLGVTSGDVCLTRKDIDDRR